MKYVKQAPQPTALRLVVSADDDADGIDFVLAAAATWVGSRLLLVVNATGKDLSGYAGRHEFAVLCDDLGRPTRSLSEIAESFELLDPDEVGAVVLLDTNRLYRATRCSVRHIEDIKRLSPGDWDDTNEALGRVSEVLTRKGVPSIFLAPPTDKYGADEDGEAMVVGSKPQAWKDLTRQAHATLRVTRSGMRRNVEVISDDHRRLGAPGTVVEWMEGAELGRRFSSLVDGSSGSAGGTTLEEATESELAARTRLAVRRRTRSEAARDRFVGLAQLRAFQGPDAWAALMQEFVGARSEMSPDDVDVVSTRLDQVHAVMGPSLRWMASAAKTADISPYPLRQTMEMAGPDPARCPAVAEVSVERVFEGRVSFAEMGHEELCSWIRSLATYAGVWGEVSFAALCSFALKPVRDGQPDHRFVGPEWSSYTMQQLHGLALASVQAAFERRTFDPPTTQTESSENAADPVTTVAVESEPEPEPVAPAIALAPVVVEATSEHDERTQGSVARVPVDVRPGDHVWREPSGSESPLTLTWPNPATFAAWTERRQIDYLPAFLHEVGAFADWDSFRRSEPLIGSSRSPARWSADERCAIYRAAHARRRGNQRAAA